MLRSLAAVLVVGVIAVGGAGANGSAYAPGLVYGWPGVASPDGTSATSRSDHPKSTIVAAMRARDGQVVRSPNGAGLLRRAARRVRRDHRRPLGRRKVARPRLVRAAARPIREDALRRREREDAHPPAGVRAATDHGPSTRSRPTARCSTSSSTCEPATTRCTGSGRSTLARDGSQAPIVDRLEDEEEMGGVPVATGSERRTVAGRTRSTRAAATHPFVHALDTDEAARRSASTFRSGSATTEQTGAAARAESGSCAGTCGCTTAGSSPTVDTGTWKVERS